MPFGKSLIFPKEIRLEASTICQLRCPSCPTARGDVGEKIGSGSLKFSDFKKLLDENDWVRAIELSNWGEIFLNSELLDMLIYAHERGVKLSAKNGANLNNVRPEVLEGLVKYNFRYITCSIDGASQESYSIYRVRGNFDNVIENIKTINQFKKQYDSEYPVLAWQFVPFGHNEHEISIARQMAEDLGMNFKIKLAWDSSFPVKDEELVRKESGLGVSSRKEFEIKNNKRYRQKSSCGQLWTCPQINYDGNILGCCVNRWGSFGNAFEEGLLAGINNEKMTYARKMLRGQAKERSDIPCVDCKHYQWMKKNNSYIVDDDFIRPGPLKRFVGKVRKDLKRIYRRILS